MQFVFLHIAAIWQCLEEMPINTSPKGTCSPFTIISQTVNQQILHSGLHATWKSITDKLGQNYCTS